MVMDLLFRILEGALVAMDGTPTRCVSYAMFGRVMGILCLPLTGSFAVHYTEPNTIFKFTPHPVFS